MTVPRFFASRLRVERYDCVVVSPHLDDAVFSMAGTMLEARARGRNVLVVTVYGHGGDAAPAGRGRYDDYSSREREDRAAMDALDVDYVWLNLPEVIFRGHSFVDALRFVVPFANVAKTAAFPSTLEAIRRALGGLAADEADIHFPLGVGAHPDHRLVCDVGRVIGRERRASFYEDVPYALYPSLLRARMAHVAGAPHPSSLRTAWDLSCFWSRGLGRYFLVAPVALYCFALSLAFGILRAIRDRVSPLVAEERDVGSYIERKAVAMRLYESQTPLFFADPSRLEAELPRSRGVPVERSWRFVA